MTKEKGRRAAERRREREGNHPALPADGHTTPGDLPPDSNERIEVGSSDVDPGDVDPGTGESGDSPAVTGTQPGRRRSTGGAESHDPEASFVREVRASKDDRSLSGESTAVKDPPKRVPRKGAKLVVIEGAEPGKVHTLTLTPSLVGRAAAADVKVADPTVSLRHFEIVKHKRSYVLFDVGSSSGTLVNGTAVNGEVELHHGDIVALGKTELRFQRAEGEVAERPSEEIREPTQVDAGQQLTKERTREGTRVKTQTSHKTALQLQQDTARAKKARVRRAALVVIGACVAILATVVVGRTVMSRAFSDKAPAQIRGQVAALLADGRKRLMEQDVDGAFNAAETVLALDKDNPDAVSLEKMARTEKDSRDAIELALRLGDEERDTEAEQILKRVPDASVFAPARDRLRRALSERGQIRSRRLIEALLDRGEPKTALEAAMAHVAHYPKDEEGNALLERARNAVASQPRDPALTRARGMFAQGDVAGARSTASDGGYRAYVADLDRFAIALEKGKAALKQNLDGAAALPYLDDAFRLLGSLGGTASSPIMGDVKKPYANALYLSGTEKLDKGDTCGAARDLFRAGRVMGDDPKIAQKLRELDDQAEQGLYKARAAKTQDADRAAAIARATLCVAKSGTKTQDELKQIARF